jgi:hypothetical protein
LLPLALVPMFQFWVAMREEPHRFDPIGRNVADTYFSILPLPVKVSLAFTIAAACYFAYLRRTGALKLRLTPRSSRAPTAGHQAQATGTVYIFRGLGLASHRWVRLSSNVRPHTKHLRGSFA